MIHLLVRVFQVVTIAGCVSSSIYYLICLWGAATFVRRRKAERNAPPDAFPPISILKPLKGTDPNIYESFRSHCLQQYPRYEIIFGMSDAADPAVASVEQLKREFPACEIRLMICQNRVVANVKVSNLAQKACVEFVAEDYELGRRIAGLGSKGMRSSVVVETCLPEYDLR